MSKTLTAIFVAAIASAAIGQTITGVSGQVSSGSSLDVSGSSFGAKQTAPPMKWDSFDDGGVAGGYIAASQPEWVAYAGGGARYSSTRYHSGGLSASNNFGDHGFATNYFRTAQAESLYVSCWWLIDNADTGDYGIVKLTRVTSSEDAGGGGVYHGAGTTYLSNANPRYMSSPYCAYWPQDNSETFVPDNAYQPVPYNEWVRIDMYIELGDAGVANGLISVDVIGASSRSWTVANRGGGETFSLDTVLLGLMSANNQGSFQLYLDDIYIDRSRARVEIGNASTLSGSTHREIQIPSAWSDEEITFTLNQGTFEADDEVYLFVVDAGGTASVGYPITIGGSGGSTGTPDIQSATRSGTNAALTWTSGDGGPYTAWLAESGVELQGIATSDTSITTPIGTGAIDVTVQDGTTVRRANIAEAE